MARSRHATAACVTRRPARLAAPRRLRWWRRWSRHRVAQRVPDRQSLDQSKCVAAPESDEVPDAARDSCVTKTEQPGGVEQAVKSRRAHKLELADLSLRPISSRLWPWVPDAEPTDNRFQQA